MINISVVIISKNDEKKFTGCLESVRWADEIIVVDNGSVDRTPDIAKKYADKVIFAPFAGFSELRKLGLKNSTGKWLLYVDTDERVPAQLKKEVLQITERKIKDSGFSAFAIPRKNIIFGKEFEWGGWWPDYVKRLFKRDKLVSWRGELHEEPDFEGKMGYLKSPLIHLKHDNISEMVEKTNKWSEVEAELMYSAKHPNMNVLRFFSAAFREFWLRFIVKKGFMDGSEGIIYSFYQIFSKVVSYAKLWEMQLTRHETLDTNH